MPKAKKQPKKADYLLHVSPPGSFTKIDLQKWLVGASLTGGAVAVTYLIENVGKLNLDATDSALLVGVLNLALLLIKKLLTKNVEVVEQ